MNNLPKYWCVKNDGSQLFKDTVIKYLNTIVKGVSKYNGDYFNCYYGFDGSLLYSGTNSSVYLSSFKNNSIVLSIERFIELSKEVEEFPEKFCIKDCIDVSEYASRLFKCENVVGEYYLCINQKDFPNRSCYQFIRDTTGFVEITIKQFKNWYNKKLTPMETKEIAYYEILQEIWGLDGIRWNIGSKIYAKNKDSLPYFKKLGILTDTTIFKPVYKEKEFKVGDKVIDTHSVYNGVQTILKFDHLEDVELSLQGPTYKRDIRKATPEEVERHELLLEAKRRYPIGTEIICAHLKTKTKSIITSYEITDDTPGYICFTGTNKEYLTCVYDNGKWAEIIPSFPEININDYTGEFFDNYVKFGCAEIASKIFISLNELSSQYSNRTIQSVTIGKGTFSKEQIAEIAKYYLTK